MQFRLSSKVWLSTRTFPLQTTIKEDNEYLLVFFYSNKCLEEWEFPHQRLIVSCSLHGCSISQSERWRIISLVGRVSSSKSSCVGSLNNENEVKCFRGAGSGSGIWAGRGVISQYIARNYSQPPLIAGVSLKRTSSKSLTASWLTFSRSRGCCVQWLYWPVHWIEQMKNGLFAFTREKKYNSAFFDTV